MSDSEDLLQRAVILMLESINSEPAVQQRHYIEMIGILAKIKALAAAPADKGRG